MKEDPITDPHQANRTFWDASTEWWKEREDRRGLWMRAPQEPRLVLSTAEMRYVADIQGVEVCVLGSGDNEVAFALAGLGGRVTSVDISARRLAVAADRARTLDLSLRFVQADVTDLSVLADDSFGLVYTGGHVSVWVADLQQYYAEAGRILAPGGLFVAHEYHPMRRMWEEADSHKPRYRYLDRGPIAALRKSYRRLNIIGRLPITCKPLSMAAAASSRSSNTESKSRRNSGWRKCPRIC
jgi:SAM-dependent methyltransferase